MEPPEPFEQSAAALTTLSPGQYFHMLHRMAPRMLYPEIATLALNEKTLQLGDEEFHIIVWPSADPAASAAAEQCCKRLSSKVQV